MPELPEVETVRRGLERLVLGKSIQRVQVFYPPMIRTGAESLMADLPGQTIEKMGRRGKYLLFYLTSGVLVSHLRMEGKYLFEEQVREPKKHEHVHFELTDGSLLIYQDVRKFGTLEYLSEADLAAYFTSKKLGPEPTAADFDLSTFEQAVLKSKKPIKAALLDQTLVVGLGNIYVDEVLHRAQVHPEQKGMVLTKQQIKVLHQWTIEVLAQAVARGGSTIRTYKNALGEDGTMQLQLQVYGRTGQPCVTCGTSIEKFKLGGRGTHICPHCQRKR